MKIVFQQNRKPFIIHPTFSFNQKFPFDYIILISSNNNNNELPSGGTDITTD